MLIDLNNPTAARAPSPLQTGLARPQYPAVDEAEVGLVHDFLLTLRGAERSFAAIADIWPSSPVYTTLHAPDAMMNRFAGHSIHASYLQRLGAGQGGFRRLLPFFPRAVNRLDVQRHRVVISSSSAFAHGVRAEPSATHICYCHSPFRYAWFEHERALSEAPAGGRRVLRRMLNRIQRWDLEASKRVTHYVANGRLTQQRMADFYDRDSVVLHPPVEIDRFVTAEPEDYFLFVGEIARHKRVEVALEAATAAGVKLKIVGDGPDRERLESTYTDGIEFLGRVDDRQLEQVYARALALVVPNVEEFGIAAVEAQAAGRPVIALAHGGALETVIDGVTGVHVAGPGSSGFAEAMRETDFTRFDSGRAVANAGRFSVDRFQQRFAQLVASAHRGDALVEPPVMAVAA